MRGALLAVVLLALAMPASAAAGGPVALVTVDGVISPVTVRIVTSALERARSEHAVALVIQLDTPGGLERSMRSIVQEILSSDVPVVVYVAPTGARAASAGVFITMAAPIAAMAPATNIGAAHPVAALGGSFDKEMKSKVENDAAAFARTIAATRGRNVEWAEKAVRQSVSATEREAVRLHIVDLLADSTTDLLDKIDGRVVKTATRQVVLHTRGAAIQPIGIGFRDRVLNIITDPNVAYVLMMLGMLGLFFELSNPGVILPGVVGGISLILAFFAFQSLPISYAGLLLILFGVVLLIAEVKITSHGVLAVGGVVAMLLGSLMLFDTSMAELRVSWWVIVPTVVVTAAVFVVALAAGLRALARRPIMGAAGMVGGTGVARSALDPAGDVLVQGELWRAVAEGGPINIGEAVRITAVDGLTLKVVKAA
ncbi:MAG: serine protease [Candidatus Rokuibacteriota bacterium]|nr:MAG: serine protease [Candidatus Rokubacteria bacterium]